MKKLTEEHRQNISKAKKGKKLTEEHKKNIGLSGIGRVFSEESNKKRVETRRKNGNYKVSDETRKKISETLKKNPVKYWLGKKRPQYSIDKWKKAMIDKPPPALGKHWILSEESKKNIGDGHRGENCHFWKGGISYQPYPNNWTRTLKGNIRKRDNYTCQICSKLQGDKTYAVHHIDYNKNNCNPDNLITLCNSCHTKTNHKREYWKEYFNNLKK